MLGAMDAAHCTFPLTRGILIDFGMFGPGNEIIPIAFGHFSGNEGMESYQWFIGNCCTYLPHLFGEESRLVLITDGKKEIEMVLQTMAPAVCHRRCYQHLLGTLMRKCSHENKKKVKSYFGNAVYATTAKKRDHWLEVLRKSDKKIDEYMVNQNVRGWTLTGDGNRSYGYVSSQLAESFHSTAHHARQLHPVAMIEELINISMTEDWIMKHQITYGKLHNDGIKLPSHVRKHIDNMTIEAADYVFKSVGVQTNDNIVIQGHVQHKDATNWHATWVVVRDEDSSHSASAIVVDEASQGRQCAPASQAMQCNAMQSNAKHVDLWLSNCLQFAM